MMKLLDTHGFKKILLEKLSLAERIRIFSSAEAVISPHGAGLANLVFCKPGTKVIEVFNPSYAFPCYWNISKNCGLDYYYLLGERRMRSPHSWPGGEDINIKMSALDQTLKLASIH
jgi:capsular polysaccharide biosynthesis protein